MTQSLPPTFLAGGGGLGALIHEWGWSSTPLGPIAGWSTTLRTTVGLILRSPVPIVTLWGPDGIMIYNDAYSVFAGGRHPQLLGSKVREGWAEVADFNDNVMRVGLAGGTLAYQDQELTLHRHGDPEQVWMDLDYSPILDEGGEPVGVIAVVVETTAKVRAERALLESEAKLRALNETLEQQVEERTRERDLLWDTSEDLLAYADFEGTILRVSPSWVRTVGHSEEFLLSNDYMGLAHPDDIAAIVANIDMLKRTRQPIRFTNQLRHVDGTWKTIAWSLVPEPGRDRFNAVGRDVTSEREAERTRLQLEEALRQSQKMEAVGQLTGGLAHDFNNLLTGITGSLDLLQKRVAQGRVNDLDRYIIAAQGSSRRAAALTHRLLAFSRRQTLDPKPTDVAKLIIGMADLIRRTVGPEITVETVDMVGLWTALVDPPQLENALLNLCINARDAMPNGGRITIETANKWMDERTARERDLLPGQYLSLCVSDTGTGMPPDIVARAFDPFFTTKPLGQGTGLGLSMIYGFARQSGGQVRIYSEVGDGTMVCIYLPRHYGTEEVHDAPADRRETPRAEVGETVLVVDDEPTVRMLVTDVLSDLGYAAIEAEDGPSGLKVLQSKSRVDLLVTDVGLPGGMNGRQVADAARVLRPGLKVLFITGYAENAVVGNGHLEPGMQVLTKPFNMDDLASRIRELIEG